MTLRVLLADDEPLARRGLRSWLASEPDVAIVAEARHGKETIAMVRLHRPDLLFLDVQMPGLDGLGALAALGADVPPAVIFVTAYDQYALEAFDRHAVDYLLKPVAEHRFRLALARARERVAHRIPDQRIDHLLRHWGSREGTWLTLLPTRTGSKVTLVPVEEVEWFEAADNYVRLHIPGRRPVIRETMRVLETRLDPSRFARVHRSAIVALARIRELEALPSGDFRITMTSGVTVPMSRTYVTVVEERLGRKL